MRAYKFILNRPVILIFLTCFIEIALILSFFTITFESNDDAGMNAIVSGARTGKPAEYLIYTNILVGKFLKHLFLNFPSTNWYSLYLIFSFSAGYFSIQYSINRLSGSFWIRLFRHFVVLLIIIIGLLNIQFTKIAAITLLGGFLLIISSKPEERAQMGLGILLIVLGSMIRYKVFLMYLLLGIPFFAFYFFKKQYVKLMMVLVASVIVLGIHWIDNYTYNNNKEFKEYKEFNKLRAQITYSDNPTITYQHKHDIVKKIGWSSNDFLLATNFNLDVGHPKFSKEKLMELTDRKKSVIEKTFSNDFIIQLQLSSLALLNYLNNPYFYIFYFFILIFLIEKRYKPFWTVLLYLLYIAGIAFFINYYLEGRLKGRVLFGMVLPLFLLIVNFLDFKYLFKKLKFINKNTLKITLLFIATGGVCIPVIEHIKKQELNHNIIETNKKMAELIEAQQDDFYVNWVILSEYNILDLPFEQKNGYNLGWFAGNPFNKDKIERYTGNRALGAYSIYNKKIVWYYRNDFFYENYAPMVKEFYLSNYKDCSYNREIAKFDENRLLIKETYFITKP